MRDKKTSINLTKEVSTFRSGKFTFSALHDTSKLTPLIMECRITNDLTKSLPVFPSLCAELNEEKLLNQYIYSTLILEGGLLNKDTVNDLLSSNSKRSKASKDVHAMRDAALSTLEPRPTTQACVITEEEIKNINKTITGLNSNKEAGKNQYRTEAAHSEELISSFHNPPKILSDTRVLMHEFVNWLNSKEIISLDPMIRSALASFHLMLIHPFDRANSKTARALESSILSTAGIRFLPLMLADFYNEESEGYFSTLKASLNIKHDLTPLLEFALRARLECLKKIRQIITSSMSKLALRDHFMKLRGEKQLTAKQFNLISSLLTDPKPISLTEIFKTNPYRMIYSSSCERTARRDLGKLTQMKLLTPRENKSYALNMRAFSEQSISGKKIKGRC
jgi:Fic family protein